MEAFVAPLIAAARRAGEAVMAVYASEFAVDYKADESPLTRADSESQALICAALAKAFPTVPIISEEAPIPPLAERRQWRRYFLVDPLDGTKEFVKKNGEFSINIALVAGEFPSFGLIYAPARGEMYWGGNDFGAYMSKDGERVPVRMRTIKPLPGAGRRVLLSRSHPSPELDAYLADVPVAQRIICGSALKFAMLASGQADFYPRLSRTYEWDTAAGQALVEGAGGSMTTLDGRPFVYNKAELANPGFLASA